MKKNVIKKSVSALKAEAKRLSYPTKEKVVKSTAITLGSAIVLSILIALDSGGVGMLCSFIISKF